MIHIFPPKLHFVKQILVQNDPPELLFLTRNSMQRYHSYTQQTTDISEWKCGSRALRNCLTITIQGQVLFLGFVVNLSAKCLAGADLRGFLDHANSELSCFQKLDCIVQSRFW